MKERILELLDAQMGKLLLAIAIVWGGLCVFLNRYEPLPTSLTDIPETPMFVGLDHKALSKASNETYYVAAPGDLKNEKFYDIVVAKQFVPVELDIPPLSVKRSPQLLPEPGPSLEGAEKLPRFGEEFAPPNAADLPPPPKKDKNADVGANPFNNGLGVPVNK